ncbi:MAG: MFS transporter [Ignavibacteria bacterium]|nr:MFS transporter [Ignavibacteria bacterium]
MHNRTTLFTICYLATVSAGIAASLFSAYLPSVVFDLTGSNAQADVAGVGAAAGASFLFGWAVGAVVIGTLSDRIGRRMALFTSVLVCTLGIVGTSLVTSVGALVIIRFLSGAGAGSILLISAVMVAEAWARSGRARMTGIIANSFPFGLIVSGLIATMIPEWRTAYLIGGSTVILALGVLTLVPESEWWALSEKQHKQHNLARERIFEQQFRPDLITGILLFGSMLVGLWAVFVWMPTFVGSVGIPADAQKNRALTTIMLGLGSVSGGFLSGPLAEWLGRRGAAVVGYLGCIILTAILFALTVPVGTVLFSLTFILSLFIGLNQGVLVGYVPELFPTLIRGVATGVCFNVGRLATTAAVLFAGLLITWIGGFGQAILIFGSAYFVGLITLAFARETKGLELPR